MAEELVESIRKALKSSKCNTFGPLNPLWAFEDSILTNPNIDLTQVYVPLIVEATTEGLDLPGKLGTCIGNIYCVLLPYSRLPELLDDERVLRIEASPNSEYITDE